MNKAQTKSLMTILLLCAFSASAGLYKGLDEEGNVTYSDKPFENAEIITPPPITVLDAPKIPAKAAPKEAVEEKTEDTEVAKYTVFKITAPTDGQTIWNAVDLSVAVKMTPALDTKHGHNMWLFMDGKPLVKKSSSPLMQIGRSDRGEHKLQAQVRNKNGKVLKTSKTITVHIKNTVVPRAKN